jgi:hypothetical protein
MSGKANEPGTSPFPSPSANPADLLLPSHQKPARLDAEKSGPLRLKPMILKGQLALSTN